MTLITADTSTAPVCTSESKLRLGCSELVGRVAPHRAEENCRVASLHGNPNAVLAVLCPLSGTLKRSVNDASASMLRPFYLL